MSDVVVVALIGGLSSSVVAAIAAAAAWDGRKKSAATEKKVDSLTIQVDGRLTMLLAQTEEAARLAGRAAAFAEYQEDIKRSTVEEIAGWERAGHAKGVSEERARGAERAADAAVATAKITAEREETAQSEAEARMPN